VVGEDLVIGLILNKSACVELSEIFPDDEVSKNRMCLKGERLGLYGTEFGVSLMVVVTTFTW
jgi:hypothetical protein